MYEIRSAQFHSNGKIGLRLVEIENPIVPYGKRMEFEGEPSFGIERFTDIDGVALDNARILQKYQN